MDLIFRGRSIKPSDDSPFVNEIFNPDPSGSLDLLVTTLGFPAGTAPAKTT